MAARAPLTSLQRVLVFVTDIVKLKYFQDVPRGATCSLKVTNQFQVPFPLVIALVLPFSAISGCNLRAVLLADESLGGLSEAPLLKRRKVLVTHSALPL